MRSFLVYLFLLYFQRKYWNNTNCNPLPFILKDLKQVTQNLHMYPINREILKHNMSTVFIIFLQDMNILSNLYILQNEYIIWSYSYYCTLFYNIVLYYIQFSHILIAQILLFVDKERNRKCVCKKVNLLFMVYYLYVHIVVV